MVTDELLMFFPADLLIKVCRKNIRILEFAIFEVAYVSQPEIGYAAEITVAKAAKTCGSPIPTALAA